MGLVVGELNTNYRMVRKFGGLAVGQASRQIKFRQILVQNIPCTGCQSVNTIDKSQSKCIQVFTRTRLWCHSI